MVSLLFECDTPDVPSPDVDLSGTLPGLDRFDDEEALAIAPQHEVVEGPDDKEEMLARTSQQEVTKGPNVRYAELVSATLKQVQDTTTSAQIDLLLAQERYDEADVLAKRANMIMLHE